MLVRILNYSQKLLDLHGRMRELADGRARPRIATPVVGKGLLAMALNRMGSLNALEQTRQSRFWPGFLGAPLPSADALGRVCDTLDLAPLRRMLHDLYDSVRRNKALRPPPHGLMLAMVDGHEMCASYLRCCPRCLRRTIAGADGLEYTQYYHRFSALSVVGDNSLPPLLLDVEEQQPGEDEVATTLRLLERALRDYPRAFDIISFDALYATGPVFNFVKSHGKEALAVFKHEERNLWQDAQALWPLTEPHTVFFKQGRCEVRELTGLKTWPQCESPVRLVRSDETREVSRQIKQEGRRVHEEEHTTWQWVTTLSAQQASAWGVVSMGHAHWGIENEGFNDLVNRWHIDHVYRHSVNAIMAMWLLTMLACNLFNIFYHRNLKAAVREACSTLHIAQLMRTELYQGLPLRPRAP